MVLSIEIRHLYLQTARPGDRNCTAQPAAVVRRPSSPEGVSVGERYIQLLIARPGGSDCTAQPAVRRPKSPRHHE